jgi:hypothetical protein
MVSMSPTQPRDFFDRARLVAVALLVGAGAIAILGTFLDWVTIEPPGTVPPDQADALATFRGIETSDGRLILLGGVVLLVCALLLAKRPASGPAWWAALVSVLIGAIGIADYRDITTVFYDEMQRIGAPSPASGLLLDAAAGIVGLIGALTGIAATPRRDAD